MLNPRTNNLTVLLSQMQVGQRHTTLYFGCLERRCGVSSSEISWD
jgi:hypothetical protein